MPCKSPSAIKFLKTLIWWYSEKCCHFSSLAFASEMVLDQSQSPSFKEGNVCSYLDKLRTPIVGSSSRRIQTEIEGASYPHCWYRPPKDTWHVWYRASAPVIPCDLLHAYHLWATAEQTQLTPASRGYYLRASEAQVSSINKSKRSVTGEELSRNIDYSKTPGLSL